MVVTDTTRSLFIGLGNMGRPMASRYAQGREVFVFDQSPEARKATAEQSGATPLESLDTLPENIKVVILMLPNSRIVEAVLRESPGLLSRLNPGSMIIDMSSSEPKSTTALAHEAAQLGIHYVDAPVSGGVARAVTGELAIMAGGSDQAVEAARPLLEAMGTGVVHVGPSGTGHAAKALNNLLSATNIAAAAEIICAAASAGIAPHVMVDVINNSTGRSQATEVKYPKHILTGAFDSGFAMDLMLKDLKIARQIFEANAVEAPVVLTAQTVAENLREKLDSAAPDHTELVRHYEQANGVLIRDPRP
ncbi:NAD(P)-dependent oxidoreductase [Pseudarthrobacter sp. NS4]|uniref:NAD(P)-dependent oxidoreductase n=1 Tax=Pseudarthrobacter sp. NS4 TaxID=2973976 RepID=UPI002162003B|nr:NAD(P)-dependent oxidoreductase [Pseudarthrobacter sp. NS4]